MVDYLLLESGDKLILEDASGFLLLESSTAGTTGFVNIVGASGPGMPLVGPGGLVSGHA